jgi:hypothetical protein
MRRYLVRSALINICADDDFLIIHGLLGTCATRIEFLQYVLSSLEYKDGTPSTTDCCTRSLRKSHVEAYLVRGRHLITNHHRSLVSRFRVQI